MSKLVKVSDDELFADMSNFENESEQAKLAWQEFYRRHHKYLWKCCVLQCQKLKEEDYLQIAKDLFQTTMHKVYVKAYTYKPQINSSVKAWLSRIAQNEFHDYLKKYHLKFIKGDIPELEDSVEDVDDSVASSNIVDLKLDKLKSLLSILTEKEYKILMVCMTYYQIDNPNAHLPDFVIDELCAEFEISPATIRQIKRRAILKLKAKAITL